MATTNTRSKIAETAREHRRPNRHTRNFPTKIGLTVTMYVLGVAWTAPCLWAGPAREPQEPDLRPGNAVVRPADGSVNYWALLCGTSNYPGTRNDLAYAAADANDVFEVLLAGSHWRTSNIWLLRDGQATRNAIYQTIQTIAARADADDVFVFYFSGHGTTGVDAYPYDEWDGLDEYLVPYDGLAVSGSSTSVVWNQCVRDDDLAAWMRLLPTSRYVVLLDTCHSGGNVKGLDETKGIGDRIPEYCDGFAADMTYDPTFKDLNDNQRGIVLTACDDDETSVETSILGNGVFTYFLVEGLRGAADIDWNGNITAEECYVYVAMHMAIWGDDQHPQLYDGNSSDMVYLIGAQDCFDVTMAGGKYIWEFPLHTYYHDSRTQTIYLADEIGQHGYITALALDVAAPPEQSLKNWTIRMKHTSKSSNTSRALDANGWTTVYQGTASAGGAGWRTFYFQTPFPYNGTDNLVIDFSHDNSSYTENGVCGYFSTGVTRTAVAYSDSNHGSPRLWSGTTSPSTHGSASATNIRLTICQNN